MRRALAVLTIAAVIPLVSAATLPVRPASGQLVPVPNAVSNARLANWVELTSAHEPGRWDDASRRALTFTGIELSGILFAVEAGRLPVERLDVPMVLARGAVLHTDVAVSELRRDQRADEASHGGSPGFSVSFVSGT